MDASFEAGFVTALLSDMKDVFMHTVKQDVPLFESLDDYIDEVISRKASPNVKLENVKNLFSYLLGFLVLVLLASIVHIVLFKQLRTIYRKIFASSSYLARQMSLGDFLFPVMKPANLEKSS